MEGNDKSGWKASSPKPFLNTAFTEVTPSFSPDGHWMAYSSNESGYMEVYVRPFPGPGGKWQLSNGGCCVPTWSRKKNELFFRTNDSRLMVASYSASGDSFRPGQARPWSTGQFAYRGNTVNYALHPDGRGIAAFRNPGEDHITALTNIYFSFNFFEELRKLPSRTTQSSP